MANTMFLLIILIPASSLFGFGVLIGQSHSLNGGQRANLRLALELSFFTILFALLPLALSIILPYEPFLWRMASLMMGSFFFTLIGRTYYKINLYRMRWPLLMIFLLVLSTILLTIEMVNVLLWATAGAYIWGLLWILTLASIQFIAFVLYDRHVPLSTTSTPLPRITLPGDIRPYYRVPDVLRQRVQRNDPPGYINGATNNYPHTYRDPIDYARRERYANRVNDPAKYRRRNIANPASGTNPYTTRR